MVVVRGSVVVEPFKGSLALLSRSSAGVSPVVSGSSSPKVSPPTRRMATPAHTASARRVERRREPGDTDTRSSDSVSGSAPTISIGGRASLSSRRAMAQVGAGRRAATPRVAPPSTMIV